MKSKKNCLFIFSLLLSSFSCANQMKLTYGQQQQSLRVHKLDVVDDFGVDDEFVDFDLDEELDDLECLVPLWARLANTLATPFFVIYNRMSHWWQDRLKKNAYVKHF